MKAANHSQQGVFEEALLALKALGYSEKETQKAAKELSKEILSTEEYIKRALKTLLK